MCDLGPALFALAPRVEALPEISAARLAAAVLAARRDLALAELAAELDPGGERSSWSLARELAGRLDRFESAAWPRVRDGRRLPRDRLEALMGAMLADATCPRSPRRLWGLLDARRQ